MSILSESSICNVTLNYLVLAAAQPPATAGWWTLQIDGLETNIMKDAMKSEYPELEKEKAHNRLSFYSPEELNYFPIMDIFSKTTQYVNSVANLGYRLVASTVCHDPNTGVVQYQYCLQK